jgi:hypothetical protein
MRQWPSIDGFQLVWAIAAAFKSMLKYREEPVPVLVFPRVTACFFSNGGLSCGSRLASLPIDWLTIPRARSQCALLSSMPRWQVSLPLAQSPQASSRFPLRSDSSTAIRSRHCCVGTARLRLMPSTTSLEAVTMPSSALARRLSS